MPESAVQYAEPLLSVQVTASGTARTVILAGELDLSVREQVEAVAERLMAQQPEMLILDLSGLSFIDSSGVEALLRIHRHAGARGVRLVIVRGPDHVHRVFSLCGLADTLPFTGRRA
jgi:anti-sigma B factor antagonist